MAAKRNVLLIVVDQWRGDHLPNLGHPALQLPNIERLAREGVTFANHFTQAVPCGPGRASMLTGLYMMNHRAVQNTVPLDARHTNLAIEARALGYDPALIGYTTTTPDPRVTPHDDPRFRILGDMMPGWRAVGPFEPYMQGYYAWLAANGFELPSDPTEIWLPQEGGGCRGGATAQPSRIPAELSDTAWFTERALSYLETVGDRPWLLHLGYYRPHPPFIAPAPYHAMYHPEAMPAPVRAADPEAEAAQHPLLAHYLEEVQQASFFRDGRGRGRDMGEAAVRQMRAAYCGLMCEIDDQLGRVFALMDANGLWDDTLVLLTCDHGEQLGDHYLLGKLGYFAESFHIPMIVRDPDAAADGTRGSIVRRFTETVDLLPTVLDWLGAEPPRACDGRSLRPFLHGSPPADWRRETRYEFDFRDIFYSKPQSRLGLPMDDCALAVLRDEKGQYVHFGALPPLFFDLEQDPHCFRNLAAEPGRAGDVMAYAQRMLDWRLRHAERTLTGYAASPEGLRIRR